MECGLQNGKKKTGAALLRAALCGALIAAATGAALAAATNEQPGFGAVAYDEGTGKYGVSWNQTTQSRADELALRACASPNCRVHPVEPKECGALARSDKDQAWGGAERDTLDDAKRDAVAHCRTHTKAGTCTVQVSGCNQ